MLDDTDFSTGQYRWITGSLVFFVFAVFFVVVAALLDKVNRSDAEFIIQSFGVLATILLVTVYLHQMAENMELHDRERKRNIYQRILSHLIEPSIDIIDHNQELVSEKFVLYGHPDAMILEKADGFSEHSLCEVTRREDLEVAGMHPLKEHFPGVHAKLVNHDQYLSDLRDAAATVKASTIDQPDIWERLPDEFQDLQGNAPALLSVYLNWRLGELNPPSNNYASYQEFLNHQDEVDNVFEEFAEDEIEDFIETAKAYSSHLDDLLPLLISIREEIRTEFGIN